MIVQTRKLALAGLVALLAATHSAAAADPSAAGLWQKVDETGKSVSWFLFVEHNDGSYEGVVAKYFLRPGDSTNQICSACRDDRKNEPLLGLSFVRGMQRNGLSYDHGNILDPRDGNAFKSLAECSKQLSQKESPVAAFEPQLVIMNDDYLFAHTNFSLFK